MVMTRWSKCPLGWAPHQHRVRPWTLWDGWTIGLWSCRLSFHPFSSLYRSFWPKLWPLCISCAWGHETACGFWIVSWTKFWNVVELMRWGGLPRCWTRWYVWPFVFRLWPLSSCWRSLRCIAWCIPPSNPERIWSDQLTVWAHYRVTRTVLYHLQSLSPFWYLVQVL